MESKVFASAATFLMHVGNEKMVKQLALAVWRHKFAPPSATYENNSDFSVSFLVSV
jgi:hypothetical protein